MELSNAQGRGLNNVIAETLLNRTLCGVVSLSPEISEQIETLRETAAKLGSDENRLCHPQSLRPSYTVTMALSTVRRPCFQELTCTLLNFLIGGDAGRDTRVELCIIGLHWL